MSPYTSEWSIASDFVKTENPDVIFNIVDSTNLSRSLFFTTQLLELGIPVVVALNKSDMSAKKEAKVDVEMLSTALHCPVVKSIATKSNNNGLEQLISEVVKVSGKNQQAPKNHNLANAITKDEFKMADKKRYAFVNKVVS